MNPLPILFNGAMARASLDDTKTQTRRVMTLQPDGESSVHVERFNQTVIDRNGDEQPGAEVFGAWWADGESGLKCPYGQPGDQLWGRETFFAWGRWETRFSSKKGRDEWHFVDMTVECGQSYLYAADGVRNTQAFIKRRGGIEPMYWQRPSIHMPRAASRITLEITGVRVERFVPAVSAPPAAPGPAVPSCARCRPWCRTRMP